MRVLRFNLNLAVVLALALGGPVLAASPEAVALDGLYAALKTASPDEAERLGREITLELSKSGSPAMDLLLKRGQAALAEGDIGLAIELLSALTDHAPGFSEGWHARSIAYAHMGLMGPAMADLEQALTLDPRNFTAIYSLAALLEELGQPGLAYEAYQRVTALHPYFDDVVTALERLEGTARGSDL